MYASRFILNVLGSVLYVFAHNDYAFSYIKYLITDLKIVKVQTNY